MQFVYHNKMYERLLYSVWIYFTLKWDNGLNCSVKMIPMGKCNEVQNILMDNGYILPINYNRFIF